MTNNAQHWGNVTGGLAPVLQRTLQDVLSLVQSGDTKIVFGVNEMDGRPCLINAIGAMIQEYSGSPCGTQPGLVAVFDSYCRELSGENHGFVTPIMAEALVRDFGKLKEIPVILEELPETGITWADVPDNVETLLNSGSE